MDNLPLPLIQERQADRQELDNRLATFWVHAHPDSDLLHHVLPFDRPGVHDGAGGAPHLPLHHAAD